MRIAIVAHNIVKSNDGQGKVNYAIVKSLILKGHKVYIYANKIEQELKKEAVAHQIRVPNRPLILKMPCFLILATLKLSYKKYDIIYANCGTYLGKCDFIACHFCATKALKYEIGFYHKIYTFLASLIEQLEYSRKNSKIIAVSKSVKNDLMKELHIPEHRIKVVYNKIDLSLFHDSQLTPLERNFLTGLTTFLYAGDLSYRKGLDFLISAMRGMDENVTLLIAGKIKKKYRRLANDLQVKFLGFQSNMADVFKEVDFLILPSLYDPFGVVVLEAMASGVPVIVSSRAGVSELIKDMEDGIILKDPTDVKELREKILLLARDEELRRRIARKAIETVKKMNQTPWDFSYIKR